MASAGGGFKHSCAANWMVAGRFLMTDCKTGNGEEMIRTALDLDNCIGNEQSDMKPMNK
ncbi:uncharacterized protein C8A04DRAFT_30898 [Dichotomopilus funicola]|uniref:Cyanovirin-N domain-containing protein n=1 Tax=Dichotomopilus funicola TaxID=1934379 RepID=A0AAN6UYE7_9PEZI|nr:hypothetical protein C8A04DRAFT_30898 [Dichotomopilus funicola]